MSSLLTNSCRYKHSSSGDLCQHQAARYCDAKYEIKLRHQATITIITFISRDIMISFEA